MRTAYNLCIKQQANKFKSIEEVLLSKNITSDSLYYIVLGLKRYYKCWKVTISEGLVSFADAGAEVGGCGPNFSEELHDKVSRVCVV